MTPRDFCYWLQGRLELAKAGETLDAEQVEVIRKHLALVFTNVTQEPGAPGREWLDPEWLRKFTQPTTTPATDWWLRPGEVICSSPAPVDSGASLRAGLVGGGAVKCNCVSGCKSWECTNL